MSPKLRKTSDRNLYQEEGSDLFIWRERIRGRNHWRSTGEKTIGAARQKVKEFRLEATGERTREIDRHTLGEAFDVLENSAVGSAVHTQEVIKVQLKNLRPWFMGDPSADPPRAAHCTYLDQLERDCAEIWSAYKRDQAALTPGRKLGHDRRILLQALKIVRRDKGWTKREFTNADFPLLERADPVGRILERSEIERLMPCVAQNPRLHLQVLLALVMGMRKREILHLKVAEVDLKRQLINLKGRRVKTRRGREVPIHERVLPMLKAWVAQAEGEYLFPAIYSGGYAALNQCQDSNSSAWERVKRLAKVRCRFHDLRHTAISRMLEAGMPSASISMVTGASEKVIRQVYAHMSSEGLKRAKNYDVGF